MKKLVRALIAFALVSCAYGCSPEEPVRQPNKYDVLGLERLPIGMWVTPHGEFRTSEAYREMAGCGINFVNGFWHNEPSPEDAARVLDMCEQAGLKYFVNRREVERGICEYSANPDPGIPDDFISRSQAYMDHPACAGELLMDEPGKPLIASVAAFTKRFEEAFPDKMWHVNLFPSYATGGIQTHSYEDYIDTWLELTEPNYLSYDSYPLLTDGGIIDDYFFNLDMIRSRTLERGIPFWTFIQTLSIANTPGVPDKREPDEADIRWQVWSNLAFGAKGIQYFCYWSPGSGAEAFSDALVARDGHRTPKYDHVRQLNTDIDKIGRILMKCDALGVIQTAREPYELYDAPTESFGPVTGICGDDNLAGCFTDDEKKNLILICPLLPQKNADVSLSIESGIKSVVITRNDSSSVHAVQDGKLDLAIPRGEAVLVEFLH